MSQLIRARSWTVAVFAFFVVMSAALAQAQDITSNSTGGVLIGHGPIRTNTMPSGALVGSFIPTAATGSNNGRGLEVVGNNIYYTEINDGLVNFPSDAIHIAPYNGGAGGADIGTLPNPRPGTGIQSLSFSRGVLYALTGYDFVPLQVFGLNPVTGAVVSGPVAITGGASPLSDGFVVLPNGNFLINDSATSCTYRQYDSTGVIVAAPPILVPEFQCTGVDTDGTNLFFSIEIGYIKTTLTGTFIASTSISDPEIFLHPIEDISLRHALFAGTPGAANCHGESVSALAQQFGGISKAARALSYPSAAALQNAIRAFCGN